MGYKRRFIGGPRSGVEESVELEDVQESIPAEDGAAYRRDEVLEGGGDVVIYKFEAKLDDEGSLPGSDEEDEAAH